MPNDLPKSPDAPQPEFVNLLQQGVSRILVFDDDSIEAILYGGAPSPPTSVSVSEMIRTSAEVSDECVRAFAAILASHPDELNAFADTAAREQKDRVFEMLVNMGKVSASENASFLKNLSRCMTRMGRPEESLDFATKSREVELKQQEAYYLARIKSAPKSAAALNDFALFLKNQGNDYVRAEGYYRKALEISPTDASCLNNLAVLLMTSLQRYEEAEQYLRRSLEQKPNDANTLSNLANLLHNYRSKSQEAEEVYSRAIELNRADANAHANYAALLICQGSWQKANQHLVKGWEAQKSARDRISARVLFLKTALEILQDKDCRFYIGQLKSLVEFGISHSPWSVEATIKHLKERLSPSEFEFFQILFDGITDWSRFAQLYRSKRWTDQAPIAFDAAWP